MKYLKTYEEGLYNAREKIYVDQYGSIHRNLKYMLCIDNNVGELDDLYNLTIGKLYKIVHIESYAISFIDDNSHEIFFNPSNVSKNFSTDKTYEDYLIKKKAEKFNI